MESKQGIVCDGCGQSASPEHIAHRLQLLEWATRFRPVHIGTLLLGAAAPADAAEFFYSPDGEFAGEAAVLAEVAGISGVGKSREQLHVAFQRGGFFATHVLECPVEAVEADEERPASDGGPYQDAPGEKGSQQRRDATSDLLSKKLAYAITRIRRSLRPKKVVLISAALDPFIAQLQSGLPESKVILNGEKAFRIVGSGRVASDISLLRRALEAEAVRQS